MYEYSIIANEQGYHLTIDIDDFDEDDLPLMFSCITVDTKKEAKKLVRTLTKAGYDAYMFENEDGSWTVDYDDGKDCGC